MSPRPPSTFEVYPAIDLRAGRVVRLRQGDFARERVYDDDPVRVAKRFAGIGATWLHVVDLDGAVRGGRRQAGLMAAIIDGVDRRNVRVQVAGGLRTGAAVAEALAAGASRVVLGTIALGAPGLVAEFVERHGPERIAVALDVRDGLAVGHGWVPGAPGTPFAPILERLTALGVATFVVTAIDRDGLLGGADLVLLERAVGMTDARIVASGGIASLADLDAVRAIGCTGAIVGRAIYDGRIDLAAALARTRATGKELSG